MKPLVIDLFAGRFGWSKGFIAEGYRAIGFDLASPIGMTVPEGSELVIQDVLTIHGSQFKDATIIVGSSPCQEFSYRAMPFKRCKALPPPYKGIELFLAQFRIQQQASEAAGRYIPLVVENVKGAQPWVGRSKAHFGSYHLWGDVESVGGRIVVNPLFGQTLKACRAIKHPDKCSPRMWSERDAIHGDWWSGTKNGGGSWFAIANNTTSGHSQNPVTGTRGFSKRFEDTPMARFSSRSAARKAKSAEIAEIPIALARWIAYQFKPSSALNYTEQKAKDLHRG